MSLLRLTLSYDGADFVGWQRQTTGVSIQGLVEAAVARLTGSAAAVAGAGRTDAGVHALAQVASVEVDDRWAPGDLRRALNALLPDSVRVLAVDAAPPGFHPRRSARAKRYAYAVATSEVLSPFARRYAWHVTQPLDRERMAQALTFVVGTRDFAAFQAAGSHVRETTRTIHEGRLEPGLPMGCPCTGGPVQDDAAAGFTIVLRGDGFLRHMVRNIAGTLVEIGRGRWPPDQMSTILASGNRRLAGPTAPPQGLFLVEVEY